MGAQPEVFRYAAAFPSWKASASLGIVSCLTQCWWSWLLALWAETKNKRQKHGVVSGRVLSCQYPLQQAHAVVPAQRCES